MDDKRWTPSLVEERLVEAADVLKRLPEERVQGYFSVWPEVVRSVYDAFGWHDPVLKRPWQSPASIDRMDETFRWLHWLDPDEVRLVWLRAEGVRWKLISHRFGINRSTAWRHWTFALIKVAGFLNGARATEVWQQNRLRHGKRNLAV